MKRINYTGSSKLVSRIVNLLNRKAPLPLDGDGDPDWGTNGQVLSTDGSGNTAWVNQGGGGSGGHTILGRLKATLTQRSRLWFADANASDASADDATKVEVVTELASESAFDNLATDGKADGIYTFPDSGGEYLTAAMSSYDNTVSGLSANDVQDAIDAVENQIANSSDAYSASTAYSVGDYCIYNDTLYRCVTACPAASWAVNSGCFVADTVVGALDKVSTVETFSVTAGAVNIQKQQCKKINNVVSISLFCDFTAISSGSAVTVGNIPQKYRPFTTVSTVLLYSYYTVVVALLDTGDIVIRVVNGTNVSTAAITLTYIL